MPEVPVVDINNNKVDSLVLDDEIFGQTVNMVLLHEVVTLQLNNRRQGTHCTKTKGLVRGGGKKPWKQKGTGRARAGSNRSPIWVGGGTVFGPLPRDYSYKMPKKKSRLALYNALSAKYMENALVVVDSLDVEHAKTKAAVSILKGLNVIDSALIVYDGNNDALYKGTRNLPNTIMLDVREINVYDLMRYRNLVISKKDIMKLIEVWS